MSINIGCGLFCEDNNTNKLCVRRIMGCLGYVAAIVGIFLKIDMQNIYMLMGTSTALLGLTTFDKFAKT